MSDRRGAGTLVADHTMEIAVFGELMIVLAHGSFHISTTGRTDGLGCGYLSQASRGQDSRRAGFLPLFVPSPTSRRINTRPCRQSTQHPPMMFKRTTLGYFVAVFLVGGVKAAFWYRHQDVAVLVFRCV
jgi:hypothetical protein